MHQCLCIDDIMRVVFGFVDEHEYDPAKGVYVRQEHSLLMLSALCRTCQTFKDPALDVLWREIPDLFVLIKSHIPSRLQGIKKANLVSLFLLSSGDGPPLMKNRRISLSYLSPPLKIGSSSIRTFSVSGLSAPPSRSRDQNTSSSTRRLSYSRSSSTFENMVLQPPAAPFSLI